MAAFEDLRIKFEGDKEPDSKMLRELSGGVSVTAEDLDSGMTTKMKLQGRGENYPDEAELKSKRDNILERIKSIKPDSIDDFLNRSIDHDEVDGAKTMWVKTIWRK